MPPVQDHYEQDGRSGHNTISKSCQRCDHCDAHYYWYHLDDTQKYFFKFMVGDFQEKMVIPDKFMKNFRSPITEVVKLEGPDGSIFGIQVNKDLNKMVFGSGWGAFASFYELKQGHLLVFRYSGCSHFKVLIFDYPSCCEKEVFHVVMNCGANAHERDICSDQSPARERRCQDGRSSNSKSCQRCEHCDTHYYWHHLDDMKKHFFKLMIGDFRQEMIIPEKFVSNLRGQISEAIKLEAPDGNMYDIQVAKDQNKIVFGSGWAAFANARKIEEHDLLVFRYSGHSHFKALIFDPSGCEKEVFHAVMNHAPHVQEREISHDQSLSRETIQQDGGSRSSERTVHTPLDSPSPGSHYSNTERTSKKTPLYSPSPGSAEGAASLEEIQDPIDLGGVQANTEPLYVLDTGWCSLTTADKARLDTLAETSRHGIPLYVRALDKTSLSGSLVICNDYAAKYLPRKDQPITLCHPQNSKTWGANLKVITDGACLLFCILSAGWPSFVRDNKLREGDICVFRVSKSNSGMTMIVHPFQGSHQPPAKEPEPPSIDISCPVKGEPSEEEGSSNEEEDGEPEYYYSRFASYLTADEQDEIFRLASIQPGNPVYVAVLRKTHVGRRNNLLVIPKKLATKHLAERSHSILLLRPNRKQKWYVRYYYHAEATRGFSCRLWSRFIKENRLHEGYVCVFELMKGAKTKTTTMTVHVIRKVDDRFILLD